MHQLSLFDTIPAATFTTAATLPAARPGPAPARSERPAPATRRLSRAELARMSFVQVCPISFIGANASCADCCLLAGAEYNHAARDLFLRCRATSYFDPSTGRLASEYVALTGCDCSPQGTIRFIREIRLVTTGQTLEDAA